MRIVHLPVSTGNQAWGLCLEERRHGHTSRVVIFEQNKYMMKADRVLFNECDGLFSRELKRWLFLFDTARNYDIVHLHFGLKFLTLYPRPFKQGDSVKQSFLRLSYWLYSQVFQYFDLILLRFLNKKIFMTFHGDDLRQGDLSKRLYDFSIASEVEDGYYDELSDNRKRKSLNVYKRFCHKLYVVTPDLLDMGGPELNWIPFTGVDFRNINFVYPRMLNAGDNIRIVHAPTHRLAKGTRFIEKAIKDLKEEGFKIDFRLIENLPHAEAMKLYTDADLVIDQLLAGWFGVFAIELMAMGKPVICYLRNHSIEKMPSDFQNELPIINANPNTIKDVLRSYLKSPALLEDVGKRSRFFAEKYFDPRRTALSILSDYESM